MPLDVVHLTWHRHHTWTAVSCKERTILVEGTSDGI